MFVFCSPNTQMQMFEQSIWSVHYLSRNKALFSECEFTLSLSQFLKTNTYISMYLLRFFVKTWWNFNNTFYLFGKESWTFNFTLS